jgi:hypothetical protein
MSIGEFGDRFRFAIECRITAFDRHFVFGNICIWANNQLIGDLEKTDLVSRVAGLFKKSVKARSKRFDPVMCEQSKEVIIEQIWNALYGDIDDGTPLEEGVKYAPYELLVSWADSFDDYVAAIVECNNKQRLIWKNRKTDFVGESVLSRGEYEAVANAFVTWMETQANVKFED